MVKNKPVGMVHREIGGKLYMLWERYPRKDQAMLAAKIMRARGFLARANKTPKGYEVLVANK